MLLHSKISVHRAIPLQRRENVWPYMARTHAQAHPGGRPPLELARLPKLNTQKRRARVPNTARISSFAPWQRTRPTDLFASNARRKTRKNAFISVASGL